MSLQLAHATSCIERPAGNDSQPRPSSFPEPLLPRVARYAALHCSKPIPLRMPFLGQQPIRKSDGLGGFAIVERPDLNSAATSELLKNRLGVLAILRGVNNDF